jgi:hypothetical protein
MAKGSSVNGKTWRSVKKKRIRERRKETKKVRNDGKGPSRNILMSLC